MRDEKASGGQLKDGEGFLEVTVESRWNDQSLSEESNVTLNRAGQHGVELRVHVSFWQGVARRGRCRLNLIIALFRVIDT